MKSIIVFECDTCKRSIERFQNILGLEVVGNCIITNGCKGKLVKQYVKKGYNTIRQPTYSNTLQDFIPRKSIYNHEQNIPNAVWIIKHNLNNDPSVQTFAYDQNRDLIEVTGKKTFIDVYTTQVTFNQEYEGVAHCFVRSTTNDQVVTTIIEEPEVTPDYIPLSVNGYVTFASELPFNNTSLVWTFYSPVSNLTTTSITSVLPDNSSTPWADVEDVIIKGKRLKVFSVLLDSNLLSGLELGSIGYLYKQYNDNEPTAFKDSECVLLLTNEPFTSVDINIHQYAITTTMSPSIAGELLRVNKTELDISATTLKNTFPYIKVINS